MPSVSRPIETPNASSACVTALSPERFCAAAGNAANTDMAAPRRNAPVVRLPIYPPDRSEEHTSELQSLMRISYAVFCLKKKTSTIPLLQETYQQPTTS